MRKCLVLVVTLLVVASVASNSMRNRLFKRMVRLKESLPLRLKRILTIKNYCSVTNFLRAAVSQDYQCMLPGKSFYLSSNSPLTLSDLQSRVSMLGTTIFPSICCCLSIENPMEKHRHVTVV